METFFNALPTVSASSRPHPIEDEAEDELPISVSSTSNDDEVEEASTSSSSSSSSADTYSSSSAEMAPISGMLASLLVGVTLLGGRVRSETGGVKGALMSASAILTRLERSGITTAEDEGRESGIFGLIALSSSAAKGSSKDSRSKFDF